jgi:hypothetical protein
MKAPKGTWSRSIRIYIVTCIVMMLESVPQPVRSCMQVWGVGLDAEEKAKVRHTTIQPSLFVFGNYSSLQHNHVVPYYSCDHQTVHFAYLPSLNRSVE